MNEIRLPRQKLAWPKAKPIGKTYARVIDEIPCAYDQAAETYTACGKALRMVDKALTEKKARRNA